MDYYLDLFSPETHEAFGKSDRSISGFRLRHRKAASRIRAGDRLLCYMTRLSRWCGILEVVEGPFEDATPIFYPEDDPFVVRFRVRPIVWLEQERAVPIYEEHVWNRLTFTRGQERGTPTWTGRVRTSLVLMTEEDGKLLDGLLTEQARGGKAYPLDDDDRRRISGVQRVRRVDKDVAVTVPEADATAPVVGAAETEVRESIQIQSLLAEIGSRMGMQIWLPRADRSAVLREWKGDHPLPIEVSVRASTGRRMGEFA